MQKFFAFLLFLSLANIYASSLRAESILNGIRVEEGTFKYQVAINVRIHRTGQKSVLNCTGALIDKSHVVTVADCVMRKSRNGSSVFRRQWYILGLASIDLKDGAVLMDVEEIFVPGEYNPIMHEADIAVLKIKEFEINFEIYPQVEKLKLPNESTDDENLVTAVASSYGYHMMRPNGTTIGDYALRYTRMNVTTTEECKKLIRHDNHSILCAKSIPNTPGEKRGICMWDSGAPLVVRKTLIGLATLCRKNCDDTVLPSGFARVKSYTEFIESVVAGLPPPGTRRFTDPFATAASSSISVAG